MGSTEKRPKTESGDEIQFLGLRVRSAGPVPNISLPEEKRVSYLDSASSALENGLCRPGVAAPLAGKLNFDAIKTELRSTLDDMVDDPDFIHMFDLVAQLGADRNSYLPDFLEFTSKCVSSKFRRLRMQTFAVLTKIKAGPLAKIALAKRSLRSKPTGKMCPPPESELEKREERISKTWRRFCSSSTRRVRPQLRT